MNTLYLAKALENKRDNDHTCCKSNTEADISELHDHQYARPPVEQPFELNQQYAGDIGWLIVNEHRKKQLKKSIPPNLREKNLNVNEDKTED